MRYPLTLMAVAALLIGAMASLPRPLWAQQRAIDLRGQAFTPAELAHQLFAEDPPTAAAPVKTRGVAPHTPAARPALAKTPVVLNVLFAFNSATLVGQSSADLDKLGSVLTQPQYQASRIQIAGHTDNVGSAVANQRLAEKRAESVKRYLVQRFAIAPERLEAQGYGALRPRSPNDSPEGRDQNRRVEVVNLGQ